MPALALLLSLALTQPGERQVGVPIGQGNKKPRVTLTEPRGGWTIDRMVTLKVEPNQYLERMVSLLTDAAVEILRGVSELVDHPNVANDHAVRAKALENRVEQVYREALADLFRDPEDLNGVMEILKVVKQNSISSLMLNSMEMIMSQGRCSIIQRMEQRCQ